MKRAFSLIELLVVIAIISLLISILLPALSTARRTAKSTIGYGNLRSLSQVMATYLGEHKEAFPNPFRPSWPGNANGMTWTKVHAISDPELQWDFENPTCPQTNTEGFAYVWYSYLAEWRGGSRADREQISPADADLAARYHNESGLPEVINGQVLMPTSFIYPPVFWSTPRRFYPLCRDEMTPATLETQLMGSVIYPAAKVMLYERGDYGTNRTPLGLHHQQAKIHIALVDGSCDTIDMNSVMNAMGQPSSADLIATRVCCPPNPLEKPGTFFATHRGVQGRDIPR